MGRAPLSLLTNLSINTSHGNFKGAKLDRERSLWNLVSVVTKNAREITYDVIVQAGIFHS